MKFARVVLALALVGCGSSGGSGGGDDGSSGGGGGGGGGGGSGGGGGGGDGGPTFKHGDVCVAPAYECGSGTNLVCVVDHPGDAQGICRLACNGFSTCLSNDDTSSMFDTDCCDIGNGGRVCDQSKFYPSGACD